MRLPVVAIIGRPNVGKSTLVNRILGKREAIVQEKSGITRDRVLYTADWNGRDFLLVDSGGLEVDPSGDLARKVAGAARAAAEEADVVVMVVDASAGATTGDRDVADIVRRTGKPVILAANKADNDQRAIAASDFFELGLGSPEAVSALHGRGIGDMLDLVVEHFPPEPDGEPGDDEPRIAIVGRPNVGKSSLFNALAGSERSIVHDEPGTTRDAVDTVLLVDGQRYRFIDTAGLRKVVRVDDSTEYYSVVRTMAALERADVALVVVDGSQGIARQDLRICEQVAELGRSAAVVLTKMDLLDADERRVERAEAMRRLPFLDYAPMLSTSAVTGQGLYDVMPAVKRILAARSVRVPTAVLNAVVDDLQARTPIPSKRMHARVKYAVQAETAPPRIVLFGPGRIPDTWLRHLERGLRDRFGFDGTPIHFTLRGPAPRRGSGRAVAKPGSRRGKRAE